MKKVFFLLTILTLSTSAFAGLRTFRDETKATKTEVQEIRNSTGALQSSIANVALSTQVFTTIATDTTSLRTDVNSVALSTQQFVVQGSSITNQWTNTYAVGIATGEIRTDVNAIALSTRTFTTVATDTTTLRTQILTVGISTGEIRADLNSLALSTQVFTTVATDTTSLRTDLNAVALSTAGVAKLNANQTFTAPNTFNSSTTLKEATRLILPSGAATFSLENATGEGLLQLTSAGALKLDNSATDGGIVFNTTNGGYTFAGSKTLQVTGAPTFVSSVSFQNPLANLSGTEYNLDLSLTQEKSFLISTATIGNQGFVLFRATATLVDARAYFYDAPTGAAVNITLKRTNGNDLFNGSFSVPAATNFSNVVTSTNTVPMDGGILFGITQTGSTYAGSNGCITIRYRE